MIGGGAQSTYWCQLLSNIFGQRLVFSDGGNVGSALGAAKLAQIACHPNKIISDIVTQPKILYHFEPNKDRYKDYQPKKAFFNRLYQQIAPLFV